ncbi:MAG TPA: hypothetical protein VN329_16695 [Roseomonas sp.]|nr:hypothetical protein [Roseomonas sp.]
MAGRRTEGTLGGAFPFPDRILPVDDAAAKILAKRTLTNLYNARPAWLAQAHDALDAAAYGWPADMAEEDALAALLALNLSRAAGPGPVTRLPGAPGTDGDCRVLPAKPFRAADDGGAPATGTMLP